MIKFHGIMAVITASCIAATTFFIKFSVIKVSPPYHKYNRYYGKEATFFPISSSKQNSETKKYISRAERIKTENNRIQYRITPTISDVSILCINRTGLYLITLSQTGGVFSNASIKKIYEGGNDAKIQIGEDRKNIIFECDIYSNPIFISTFK
jgi:hypothetical protein